MKVYGSAGAAVVARRGAELPDPDAPPRWWQRSAQVDGSDGAGPRVDVVAAGARDVPPAVGAGDLLAQDGLPLVDGRPVPPRPRDGDDQGHGQQGHDDSGPRSHDHGSYVGVVCPCGLNVASGYVFQTGRTWHDTPRCRQLAAAADDQRYTREHR